MSAHSRGDSSDNAGAHLPVMVDHVLAALTPRDDGIYVDGTFGAGGYSRAILDAADCRVIGIDRDPDAVSLGADLASAYSGRLTLVQGRFSEMQALLRRRSIQAVDGVTLDLGVSSMQLDQPERGFSFRSDGPLDMRMERQGRTAEDVVNAETEESLARIIRVYGEERHARSVARTICAERAKSRITRTAQLAEIVRRAVGRRDAGDIDPATRTFQAIRIFVNDELVELAEGLAAAEAVLREKGRLAVVTFHSLEDRLIKTFLRTRSAGAPRGSRHLPEGEKAPAPSFRLLTRRPQRPSVQEVARNPRARSARLRTAERTSAPPFAEEFRP